MREDPSSVTSRATALVGLLLATACSRANDTPPNATPEPRIDASVNATMDAGASVAAPSSPFSVVARTQIAPQPGGGTNIAAALPLVQRLPGGGLVVASEYARASADGPGSLSVELVSRGFETSFDLRSGGVTMDVQGRRWVWSDPTLSIVTDETETSRSGPRLTSYKLGPKGFEPHGDDVGFWSAVSRDGSVLALSRTAYEIPNSSAYPKGSEYEQNDWGLKPARVAVLAGRAKAPVLPPAVCPSVMSAAPDGSLVIAVEKCGDAAADEQRAGVLRYAPGATQAKVEWFASRSTRGKDPDEVIAFAASATELYVAVGDDLETWNGKEWASSTPFHGERFASLSRSPDGVLWAVLVGQAGSGRVMKRAADRTWSEIRLPLAPDDPLDDVFYAGPTLSESSAHFVKVSAPPPEQAPRAPGAKAMNARFVDAAGEDVLVLASVEREGFVLSTRPRVPVARLPSFPVQRARILKSLPPRFATSASACYTSYLLFPEGTTIEALRAKLGDAGASLKVGESSIEGKTRLVVFGDRHETLEALKRFASLAPKRACGLAVVEREL